MKLFISSSMTILLFIAVSELDAWRLLHAKQDDALFTDGSVPFYAVDRYLYDGFDDDGSNTLLPFFFFIDRNVEPTVSPVRVILVLLL